MIEWDEWDDDEPGLRMKDARIGDITLVVSQNEDDVWRWTCHVEVDALIEPDVLVDTELEAEQAVLEVAERWLKEQLRKVRQARGRR